MDVGCFEVNLPVTVLKDLISKDDFSERQKLTGSCQKQGKKSPEVIQMYAERRDPFLSLTFCASDMGTIFKKKLSTFWSCEIHSTHMNVHDEKTQAANKLELDVSEPDLWKKCEEVSSEALDVSTCDHVLAPEAEETKAILPSFIPDADGEIIAVILDESSENRELDLPDTEQQNVDHTVEGSQNLSHIASNTISNSNYLTGQSEVMADSISSAKEENIQQAEGRQCKVFVPCYTKIVTRSANRNSTLKDKSTKAKKLCSKSRSNRSPDDSSKTKRRDAGDDSQTLRNSSLLSTIKREVGGKEDCNNSVTVEGDSTETLTCTQCRCTSFKSTAGYLRHVKKCESSKQEPSDTVPRKKSESNLSKEVCGFCGCDSFETVDQFDEHLSSCPMRPEDLKDTKPQKQRTGQKSATKEKNLKFVCDICAFKAFSQAGLKRHHVRIHQSSEDIKPVPPLDSEKEQRMISLLKGCGNAEELTCPLCQRSWFTSKIAFKKHFRKCANDASQEDVSTVKKRFMCEKCKTTFRLEQTMKRHLRDVHGMSTVKHLTSERRKSREIPRPCQYCGTMFQWRISRIKHEKYSCQNNPNVAKAHYCTTCNKVFDSKEVLAEHVSTSHPNGVQYVCAECGVIFRSRSGFYFHKLREHSGGKALKFQCDICDKSFLTNSRLTSHRTKHFGERNCMCEVCGKSFKNKSQVRNHIKSVHMNRYPYHCKQCGHGMQKKEYLKAHVCGRVRRVQNVEVDPPIEEIKIEELRLGENEKQPEGSGPWQVFTVTVDPSNTKTLVFNESVTYTDEPVGHVPVEEVPYAYEEVEAAAESIQIVTSDIPPTEQNELC